jgi:hypothetical protein
MSPFVVIISSFLIAKSILLLTVLGTTFLPDISVPFYHPPKWPFGYDSSSSIFLPDDSSNLGRVVSGLFRWDTVYFASLADRGQFVWEQEWAFGPGWPALIRASAPSTSFLLDSDGSITTIPPIQSGAEASYPSHVDHPLEFISFTRANTTVRSDKAIIPS